MVPLYLAQAVDLPAQVGTLAQYGAIGVLLIVFIAISYVLKTDLTTCWKERIADGKAVFDVMQANSVTLQAMTQAMAERTRAQEATARALELSSAAQGALTTEVGRLRDQVGSMSNELRQLRDWIATQRATLPPSGAG